MLVQCLAWQAEAAKKKGKGKKAGSLQGGALGYRVWALLGFGVLGLSRLRV